MNPCIGFGTIIASSRQCLTYLAVVVVEVVILMTLESDFVNIIVIFVVKTNGSF